MVTPADASQETFAARVLDADHSWYLCRQCGEVAFTRGRHDEPPACPTHGPGEIYTYVRLDLAAREAGNTEWQGIGRPATNPQNAAQRAGNVTAAP
jgi:hypothetical protein